MKIHLITNLFHPDELAGAALYTDFARYLKNSGHEVRVTAAFPYYPGWKLRPEDKGVKSRDEVFQGIPVRRVSLFIPSKPRGLTRLFSDATFLFSIIRRGLFAGWTPDVAVTACPMLSQCAAQRFIYRGKGVKKLVIVQDFVVDAAFELGILKLPGLAMILRGMENWALRSAHGLSTISPEMLEKLKRKIGSRRPLRYIPNWVHRDLADEIERQEEAAPPERQRGTLFYSGNLGVKQGLPDFIEEFTTADSGWALRIQGGGPEAESIRQRVAGTSISFGPIEDLAAYVRSLRQCAACLVTQRAGVTANFLPSKLLPALATKTPVLAIAEADSPLAREIVHGGYGLVVRPGDVAALRVALTKMSEPAELKRMTAFATERALFFGRERVLEEYASFIRGLEQQTESRQVPQLIMSRS